MTCLQSAVFLLNSRSHLFIAALSPFWREPVKLPGRTLSRSYGTNLPSSFSRVLSSALEYSSRAPVSVCGTVVCSWSLVAFPGSRVSLTSEASLLVITPHLRSPDLPRDHDYTLEPGHPTPGWPNLLRPPIAVKSGTGILTCFPSATHLCLALGADSPCSDER